MNLTKLFNFKYLIQNIKKSKMALVLFFIIVPIFTSLTIMTTKDQILDFSELAFVNIFGMYIIPFIFSVCLFGYVYKKNSVDFMCSMPVSRKTIFVTNTIGGIGMIVLMQLITLILTLLIGVVTGATIFNAMVFDIFAYQTIAYIFVFTIANLAMSVSGNLLTLIVVTLLITFLIPFSTFFVVVYTSNNVVALYNEYGDIGSNFSRIINYTAPSMIFNGEYNYSSISMCKMAILSIIYFALGLYLFKKRKMEIATESFENNRTHFLVKGLTLAPFVALLISFINYESFELILILLGIIFIYYFVYDLITNKKMKFKDNVTYLVISVLILLGAYYSVLLVYDNYDGKLNIDNIKELTVGDELDFTFNIKNKDSIKKILLSSEIYNYVDDEYIWERVTITRNDGTKFKRNLYININDLSDAVDGNSSSHKFDKTMKLKDRTMDFTEKEETEFIKKIAEGLNQYTCKEYLKLRNESLKQVSFYGYKNHRLISAEYPIEISEDVFKMATKAYNKYAGQKLENSKSYSNYITIKYYNKNSEKDYNDNLYDRYSAYLDDESVKYIIDNANVEIKGFKTGVFATSYYFTFYAEDVSTFLKLLETNEDNFGETCLDEKPLLNTDVEMLDNISAETNVINQEVVTTSGE